MTPGMIREKKPARVICAAVRAKSLTKAKGKTELYVKVRVYKTLPAREALRRLAFRALEGERRLTGAGET